MDSSGEDMTEFLDIARVAQYSNDIVIILSTTMLT